VTPSRSVWNRHKHDDMRSDIRMSASATHSVALCPGGGWVCIPSLMKCSRSSITGTNEPAGRSNAIVFVSIGYRGWFPRPSLGRGGYPLACVDDRCLMLRASSRRISHQLVEWQPAVAAASLRGDMLASTVARLMPATKRRAAGDQCPSAEAVKRAGFAQKMGFPACITKHSRARWPQRSENLNAPGS